MALPPLIVPLSSDPMPSTKSGRHGPDGIPHAIRVPLALRMSCRRLARQCGDAEVKTGSPSRSCERHSGKSLATSGCQTGCRAGRSGPDALVRSPPGTGMDTAGHGRGQQERAGAGGECPPRGCRQGGRAGQPAHHAGTRPPARRRAGGRRPAAHRRDPDPALPGGRGPGDHPPGRVAARQCRRLGRGADRGPPRPGEAREPRGARPGAEEPAAFRLRRGTASDLHGPAGGRRGRDLHLGLSPARTRRRRHPGRGLSPLLRATDLCPAGNPPRRGGNHAQGHRPRRPAHRVRGPAPVRGAEGGPPRRRHL